MENGTAMLEDSLATSCKAKHNLTIYKFGQLSSACRTGKGQFVFNPKEEQCQIMFKLLHNCTHLTCQQKMLKILQARLQQQVNQELPDVEAGFRKGRGTRYQIANIRWIMENAREFQKNTTASLTMLKHLTVQITTNYRKFLKRWNTRPPDLPAKSVCR